MPLPVLVNLDLASSLHSCDQCNQRRRRCDRKVPSCSQCLFREASCSYNRTLKRCQVLERKPASITPPSSKSTRLVIIPFTKKLPVKLKLTILERNTKLMSGMTIDKLAMDWPYTVSGFIDYLKGNINSKCPPIYIAKPCLAPCLPVSSMWTHTQQHIPFQCFELSSLASSNLMSLKLILDQALLKYLQVINPFNPLFIASMFHNRPRSDLLMSAIWLSGLHHIENKGPIESQVQVILQSQLQAKGKLSLLPKTLDSLQFILVMLVGMRGYSEIDSTVRVCQNIVTRLAYMIGAHITVGKPNLTMLEKRLAYNLASTTDTTRGWGLQLPYLRSIDHTIPLFGSKIMNSCFYSIQPNPDQNNAWDLFGIAYSNFLFDNNKSLYDLHIQFNQLTNGQVTLDQVKRECQININQTQLVSNNYVRYFYNLQFQLDLEINTDSISEYYVCGSLMYTRVLCYAITSLIPIAESDPRLNYKSTSPNSQSLQIVLDWANQVLTASLQFSTKLPIFEGRVFLTTTALTFIVRNLHLHSNPHLAKLTLKKAYLHLKALSKHVGLKNHVNDNLNLLIQLCKDVNQGNLFD